MKVIFSFQNNSFRPQKQKLAFGAGLTPKMMREIKQTDPLEISRRFARKNIPATFNGDQTLAWLCGKCADIIEYLKRFGHEWHLPTEIGIEDFVNLNVDDIAMTGFCNPAPTFLRKNSTLVTPAKAIFFNTFETVRKQIPKDRQWLYDWRNINAIADENYANKYFSTGHFLTDILHEFIHPAHESRMQSRLSGKEVIERIKLAKSEQKAEEYRIKYGDRISQICNYALENPLEAIACDMTRVIVDSLNPETLMPTKNPFIGTPYENLSFWQRVNIPDYPDSERPLQEILRRFWNGQFE